MYRDISAGVQCARTFPGPRGISFREAVWTMAVYGTVPILRLTGHCQVDMLDGDTGHIRSPHCFFSFAMSHLLFTYRTIAITMMRLPAMRG